MLCTVLEARDANTPQKMENLATTGPFNNLLGLAVIGIDLWTVVAWTLFCAFLVIRVGTHYLELQRHLLKET